MPTTSRGYPYPDLSSAPNVPADIQALAVALDTDLASPARPFAQAAGAVILAGTAVVGGAFISAAIAFPAGRFSVNPLAQVTIAGANGGEQYCVAHVVVTSPTAATLYVYNAGTTAMTWASSAFNWYAVQMTPTTAAG